MMHALWVSATGMSAQQLNMDTIANNLANVNTMGYKSAHAQFADVFYQQVQNQEAAGDSPAAPAVGLGTRNIAIAHEYSQGEISATGNPLDVAVQGDGFLQVVRPDGTLAYTRDGALQISGDGTLCNTQGYHLSPEIQIPADATDVSIAADGTVSVRTAADAVPRPVGQLELSRFVNPSGLQNLGQNLAAATPASGEPQTSTPGTNGLGVLAAGSLERSNVNLITEMVNMILAQRAYEVNTKAVQATDEMMRMANNLRR
jgi:flagellar basal-body rod protein FlgG